MGRPMGIPMGRPMRIPMGRPMGIPRGRPMGRSMGRPMGIPMGGLIYASKLPAPIPHTPTLPQTASLFNGNSKA